jgi:VIT1/CCC1 family predicted Fe2+/Mn2+ transporter
MINLSRYSFGATAAISTSLALIAGFDAFSGTRPGLIGALLVIGIADNISDSLGIHIYQESKCTAAKNDSASYTLTNFLTRLALTLVFIAIVYFMPTGYASPVAVLFGLALLSVLSYIIALNQKTSPLLSILHHLGISVLVIAVSYLLGRAIKTVLPQLVIA